jgi:hypothetical protein
MGYEDRPEQSLLRQFGGLNTHDGELGLPIGDSPDMDNVDLHPVGSIQKRLGMAALTSPTGKVKIDAVMRLVQPDEATPRGWVYVVADNTIYRVPEPGTWTWQTPTHASSYTLVAQKVYGRQQARYNSSTTDAAGTEYPAVLYLPRSNGTPLIALGASSATGDIISLRAGSYGNGVRGTPDTISTYGVTGYPSEWGSNHWPRFMRLIALGRGSRMHAWGFANDKSKVAYSEMDVPWNYLRSQVDFPGDSAQPLIDGGYYYARRGDGDEVTSVVDMFSYTVVFKRHVTLIYTGDPGDESGWLLSAEFPIGCVGDRAWVKVGNDLFFWSEDGPRSLSAVQEYGDLAQAQLAIKISEDVTGITPDAYERICCYHDIPNMRVVWFVPRTGATNNDTAYVYYYQTNRWTTWSGARCEMMDVLSIKPTALNTERVIGGSYDKGLVQHNSGYADVAESVAADYTTDWIRFGEVSDGSRSLWLDVFFGESGANVEIYYQTDLNSEWTQITRIVRSYGGTGTTWRNFTWGNANWAVTGRSHRAYELDQIFRMIRLKFVKSSTGGFEVMGYRLEARRKGARA